MSSNKKGIIERPRTTCAHGGALATLGSLPGVVAISHAAEGCAGNLTNAISACSGNNGEGYCGGMQTPTSAVREKNVIFGGTKRLQKELETAQAIIDAQLFVVVTGCMTEIIGDDIQGVIDEFVDAPTPVIAVNTPSFEGDAYVGYELIMDGIFNRFLRPAKTRQENLVNLFGIIPNFDPFYRGDLEEIKRILERLGLKVNTFFTPDQTFENIIQASSASLNINLSRTWGSNFLKKFEDTHKTPFWETELPIGAEATERFIRELTEHITVDQERVEKVIQEEKKRYYDYFIRTLDLMVNSQFFYYTGIVANSNYAIPLALFLKMEMGWQVDDIFITDLLDKKKKELLLKRWNNELPGGELLFETDTKQIAWQLSKRHPRNHGERYFDQHTPFYLVGSALEKYAAADIGALTLAVSYPVYNRVIATKGYAGFQGGLNLLEDLISVPVSGR